MEPGIPPEVASEMGLGGVSLLKPVGPRSPGWSRCFAIGTWQGLGWGILLGILVAFVLAIVDPSLTHRRQAFVLALAGGSLLGAVIVPIHLLLEWMVGYLAVDDEQIIWRTPTGIVKIPLELVFGAGPENDKSTHRFRFCYLKDNVRGFACRIRHYEHYRPLSGPLAEMDLTGKNGNDAAREAVVRHIENRRNRQMTVAELPKYRFISKYELKRFTFDSDEGVLAEFRCDGRQFHYEWNMKYEISGIFDTAYNFRVPDEFKQNIVLDIPVRCVRSVASTRGVGGYSHGEGYFAYLKLDPSCGRETLTMDLTLMTYSREVEKYLACLPTLFPEPEKDAETEPLMKLN